MLAEIVDCKRLLSVCHKVHGRVVHNRNPYAAHDWHAPTPGRLDGQHYYSAGSQKAGVHQSGTRGRVRDAFRLKRHRKLGTNINEGGPYPTTRTFIYDINSPIGIEFDTPH